MPQNGWSPKRERQYEHIKGSLKERGANDDKAEEIAARTVNKERARSGEARQPSRTSIADIFTMNFSDFAAVSALAAGLFPLTGAALKSYIVAHRAELAPFMCEVIPEWAICYVQYPDAQIQSDGTFSTTDVGERILARL